MAKRSNGSGRNGAGKSESDVPHSEEVHLSRREPAPGAGARNVHVLKPATARVGGWDIRNLFADWPRRLIVIGCMFGFWALVMDSWTEEARSAGLLEAHGFWVFAQFGKDLAGESAFAAGKWLVPVIGIAWCLYCSGIGPRAAPPWVLTWPLMTVVLLVLWELVDYFETVQQVKAAWAQHPDVAVEPPGGMLRFAVTQIISGIGAWRLYRSQTPAKGANRATPASK